MLAADAWLAAGRTLVLCWVQRAAGSAFTQPHLSDMENEGKQGREQQTTVAYGTTIQATETMGYQGALRKPLLSRSWTNIPAQQ